MLQIVLPEVMREPTSKNFDSIARFQTVDAWSTDMMIECDWKHGLNFLAAVVRARANFSITGVSSLHRGMTF